MKRAISAGRWLGLGAFAFACSWQESTLSEAGAPANSPGSDSGEAESTSGQDGGVALSSPTDNVGAPADGGTGRLPRCDANGRCSCINIASIGKAGHYGANAVDTTDSFRAWLSGKSSANVVLHQERTTLTPALLSNYDMILFQALEDGEYGPFWSFSAAEIDALVQWVNAGGGIIALSGYGADPREIDPINQLLAFTGISYNSDDILVDGDCPDGLCSCTDCSIPITEWSPESPISAALTAVGGYHGHSLKVPSEATVVASRGTVVLGASRTVGEGRVFAFADEWVTYTSQWESVSPQDQNQSCYGRTAASAYQVPQFWYNAIRYVAPAAICFTIDHETL